MSVPEFHKPSPFIIRLRPSSRPKSRFHKSRSYANETAPDWDTIIYAINAARGENSLIDILPKHGGLDRLLRFINSSMNAIKNSAYFVNFNGQGKNFKDYTTQHLCAWHPSSLKNDGSPLRPPTATDRPRQKTETKRSLGWS